MGLGIISQGYRVTQKYCPWRLIRPPDPNLVQMASNQTSPELDYSNNFYVGGTPHTMYAFPFQEKVITSLELDYNIRL